MFHVSTCKLVAPKIMVSHPLDHNLPYSKLLPLHFCKALVRQSSTPTRFFVLHL
ncbi:hypothetical protein Hdeb2414_s0022g00610621 [Helianthus debilis subsp. tardiflorus]